MLWFKLLTLWLVVLHTAVAFDYANPFSWQAIADADEQATAEGVSLCTESERLQQRLKEQVFVPEVADTPPPLEHKPSPEPVIQHQAPGRVKVLVLTVLAGFAVFLYGWHCGARQAQSCQTMQQARAAVPHTEALDGQCTQDTAASSAAMLQQQSPGSRPLQEGAPVPHSDPNAEALREGQALAAASVATTVSSISTDSASLHIFRPCHQASQSSCFTP